MTDNDEDTWVCGYGKRHPNPAPGYAMCCGCPADTPWVDRTSTSNATGRTKVVTNTACPITSADGWMLCSLPVRHEGPHDMRSVAIGDLTKPITRHQELSDDTIDRQTISDLRAAYRTLRDHHVAETTALISRSNDLARRCADLTQRCDKMLAKSKNALAASQQLVERTAAIVRNSEEVFAARAADTADLRTCDHLSDEELVAWATRAGVYNATMTTTYLRMVIDELRERRDAEAMFADADLQLQRIASCETCAEDTHATDDEHRAIVRRWRIAQGALCALVRLHRGYLRSLDAPDEGDPQ